MLQNILQLLRVYQWTKNVLVFAALIFAQRLSDQHAVYLAFLGFISFSFASSASYVVNDIVDKESDKKHFIKRHRPIAAGVFSVRQGWMIAIGLYALGFLCALLVSGLFVEVLALYVLLIGAYTYVLKQIELLDILIISVGFVIRAIAGGVAIGVTVSNWLFITTFFLALFLIVGKRRHEVLLMGDSAFETRKSLKNYSPQLLDILITIVSTASLLSYVLYTQAPDVIDRLGTSDLIYTVPLVVYGLFRYLLLVYNNNKGEDPSHTLMTDMQIILSVVLWGASVIVIIYL